MAIKTTTKEEVWNLAMVSGNSDEAIASVICQIYEKVGLQGAISILDGDGTHREIQVDFVQGL